MRRLAIVAAAATCAIGVGGCGDDGGGTPDAGGESQLEILDPPGDSIGLAFAAGVDLRVRYLDPSGAPVPGVAVTFELVAGPSEEVGASTLSASSAGTGDDGIARASLTAGPRQANFRVRASAPNAAPVLFFVVVSDSGFANFRVNTTHQGPRQTSDYTNIELRLFSPDDLACTDVDIDALPDSVLPPRRTDGFGEPARFTNLAANRPYTLVAWGEHTAGDARLAVGCVELAASQVAVGPELNLTLSVFDRPLVWPEAMPLATAIVLPDLATEIDAAVSPDPWPVLSCPLGAAQLAIDCSLDAQFADGALDCVVNGSDSVIDAINALRGAVDMTGCRPDEVSPGTPSLDQTLADRLTAGPWTLAGAIALASAQNQLLSGLSLESELAVASQTSGAHRLTRLTLAAGGLFHAVDLTSSGRPITSVPVVLSLDDTGIIGISDHGFTLDLDLALAEAFEVVYLPANGLDGRAADLGAALMASYEDGGAGTSGCGTVSGHLCTAIASPASCLQVACGAAATALDSRLGRWATEVAAGGLDFRLSGSALVEDADFDLEADRVGGGPLVPNGSWAVSADTGAGTSTGVGAFGGEL